MSFTSQTFHLHSSREEDERRKKDYKWKAEVKSNDEV